MASTPTLTARISAMSFWPILSSFSSALRPSVIIVMQNGTAGGERVGARVEQLQRALHVHALGAVLLFHEHLRAAGAAAQALGLVPVADLARARRRGSTAGSRAASRRRRCSGRGSSCRGTTTLRLHRLLGLELARLDQAHEEVRVVHDLELAAEVGVLVLQRVEAVRAGRDDGLLVDVVAVQRLDVLLRPASGTGTRCRRGARGRPCRSPPCRGWRSRRRRA